MLSATRVPNIANNICATFLPRFENIIKDSILEGAFYVYLVWIPLKKEVVGRHAFS